MQIKSSSPSKDIGFESLAGQYNHPVQLSFALPCLYHSGTSEGVEVIVEI